MKVRALPALRSAASQLGLSFVSAQIALLGQTSLVGCVRGYTEHSEMASETRIKPLLRLKLTGPGVKRGRISVPELIEICRQAQAAVNRQAQARDGHRTLRPGPIMAKVQTECTLELLRIGPGSTMLDFGVEKPQLDLQFEDFITVGAEAIGEIANTLDYFATSNGQEAPFMDRGVLDSLHKLGSVFDRKRVSHLEWIIPGSGRRKRRAVNFDPKSKDRVERALRALPQTERTTIEGRLEMADFKPEDRKCRIDPPLGKPVNCTFDRETENRLQSHLREAVRVSGVGEYDPETGDLRVLHIETLESIDPISLGAEDFDASKDLMTLIREQGVKPLKSIRKLQGLIGPDESFDEMLEEIYATRG